MIFPLCVVAVLWSGIAQGQPASGRPNRDTSAEATKEAYKGITTDGKIKTGLFKIQSTGVSTEPVRKAADAFLAGLTEEQRKKTMFPVDDSEWRKWDNRSFPLRQGVGFKEMTPAQRELAFGLFKASLSAKGLKTTRDIMKLNETIAEMTKRFDDYGEGLYWITVMGKPSDKEPWGWQLDGHHAIINYFVLGDQVVMSPVFMGSEPIRAESGKYKGTVVLQAEQDKGLAFMRSLDEKQQGKARIRSEKGATDTVGEAYKDNIVLDYAGLPATAMNLSQTRLLLGLISEYVSNMERGHAKVKMSEVEKHLEETYFGWIGSTEPNEVFYYRIHSPVILIEFDHQRPIALGRDNIPTRNHIHTVVRTPNGNDYGKDLLRQHYAKDPH